MIFGYSYSQIEGYIYKKMVIRVEEFRLWFEIVFWVLSLYVFFVLMMF